MMLTVAVRSAPQFTADFPGGEVGQADIYSAATAGVEDGEGPGVPSSAVDKVLQYVFDPLLSAICRFGAPYNGSVRRLGDFGDVVVWKEFIVLLLSLEGEVSGPTLSRSLGGGAPASSLPACTCCYIASRGALLDPGARGGCCRMFCKLCSYCLKCSVTRAIAASRW